MSSNTLKGSSWYVHYQSNGSNGVLALGEGPTGTYKTGFNQDDVVWGETWNGDHCALWVVFKSSIDNSVLRIWGVTLTMTSGTGVTAYGKANNLDPTDTGFVNDYITLKPA